MEGYPSAMKRSESDSEGSTYSNAEEAEIPMGRIRSLSDVKNGSLSLQAVLGEEDEEKDSCPVSPQGGQSAKCHTEVVQNSLARWTEASQTLFFLDWDDTLFPTTQLFDTWGFSSQYGTWDTLELSAEQDRLLILWSAALKVYLQTAKSLSERYVIVTNALRPWVSECIKRFAPSLQHLFEREDGPQVVYAREALSTTRGGPGSPRGNPSRYTDQEVLAEEMDDLLKKAKFAAMQVEANRFYSQYKGQTWKNIISVGDAKYEHDAAQDLAFRRRTPARERLRVKTIVTPENPSLTDLIYRLRLGTLLLPAYVHFDGDLDIDMNNSASLTAVADALCMPELKRFNRPWPIMEEDEEAFTADFDEVAMLVHDQVRSPRALPFTLTDPAERQQS